MQASFPSHSRFSSSRSRVRCPSVPVDIAGNLPSECGVAPSHRAPVPRDKIRTAIRRILGSSWSNLLQRLFWYTTHAAASLRNDFTALGHKGFEQVARTMEANLNGLFTAAEDHGALFNSFPFDGIEEQRGPVGCG